jgi:GTPase SAR1 family protein
MENIQKLRLVILGGESVGKTSLTHTILDGSILEVEASSTNLNSINSNNYSSNAYENLNSSVNLEFNITNSPNSKQGNTLLTNTDTNLVIENNTTNDESKKKITEVSEFNFSSTNNSTTRTRRSSSGNSIQNQISEIGNKKPNHFSQKTIEFKGIMYKITIYDSVSLTSASNEFFDNKMISDIQGFILVFSLDDELSFETIQHINQVLISKVGFKYVPRVLVGNKSDQKSSIDENRIKKLKNKLICPYVECSVKEGSNLDKILVKILKEIHKEYRDEHPYDIINANRQLNCISRQAFYYRHLLNILFIGIIVSDVYKKYLVTLHYTDII